MLGLFFFTIPNPNWDKRAITYVTRELGMSRSTVFNGILLAAVIEIFTIPAFGYLSDRYGRKPLFIAAACSRFYLPSRCSGSSRAVIR